MTTVSADLANRRVEPRRRPRSGVCVKCVKGTLGLGNNLAIAVLDASETGIRLRLKTALEKGQEIEVNVVGPGRGRPCMHLAEVIWCVHVVDGSFCVGARFRERLSYADLQDICL